MKARIVLLVLCVGALATSPVATQEIAQGAAAKPDEGFGTITMLPRLGGGGEARAIDETGTFIVGEARDESGQLHAVQWTQQGDGSWAITVLQTPPGTIRSSASGVTSQGEIAGDDFNSTPSHALLWPTATSAPLILDCPDAALSIVDAISADGQVLVGNGLLLWRPGGTCERLPVLPGTTGGAAHAVNGDGTIVGGLALATGFAAAARWTNVAGEWHVEQLDSRHGEVWGANAGGDLVGYVITACGRNDVCQRGIVWYTSGASVELGTLGGESSVARDINSDGEVVGISMARRGNVNAAFFWSQGRGMVRLPSTEHFEFGMANALSDVRPDGTRLVVGVSGGLPVVWVVPNQ